ncbi:hypothetical protein PPERSA_02384 [Pseudocohnilembus persalinus]|uniref:Uncharacterized protein n=1 Tax=Pseudocohnilembus persalinus TaxID=266149 RepID=A0A0V0Q8N1_PSEPJ|nr:hypothetical protein PPERSA_02384 [Pseudocohnilembus persalinus]|eukprot:KRW98576.1 hypothetical protein PPERSA_02384 [Pseudocohnilembus persalinus]
MSNIIQIGNGQFFGLEGINLEKNDELFKSKHQYSAFSNSLVEIFKLNRKYLKENKFQDLLKYLYQVKGNQQNYRKSLKNNCIIDKENQNLEKFKAEQLNKKYLDQKKLLQKVHIDKNDLKKSIQEEEVIYSNQNVINKFEKALKFSKIYTKFNKQNRNEYRLFNTQKDNAKDKELGNLHMIQNNLRVKGFQQLLKQLNVKEQFDDSEIQRSYNQNKINSTGIKQAEQNTLIDFQLDLSSDEEKGINEQIKESQFIFENQYQQLKDKIKMKIVQNENQHRAFLKKYKSEQEQSHKNSNKIFTQLIKKLEENENEIESQKQNFLLFQNSISSLDFQEEHKNQNQIQQNNQGLDEINFQKLNIQEQQQLQQKKNTYSLSNNQSQQIKQRYYLKSAQNTPISCKNNDRKSFLSQFSLSHIADYQEQNKKFQMSTPQNKLSSQKSINKRLNYSDFNNKQQELKLNQQNMNKNQGNDYQYINNENKSNVQFNNRFVPNIRLEQQQQNSTYDKQSSKSIGYLDLNTTGTPKLNSPNFGLNQTYNSQLRKSLPNKTLQSSSNLHLINQNMMKKFVYLVKRMD